MLEHKPGTLYLNKNWANIYLAVLAKEGPQLIKTDYHNLWYNGEIFMFNFNISAIIGDDNPLEHRSTHDMGYVQPDSLRILENFVGCYEGDIKGRYGMDGVFNRRKTTVVLPRKFFETYQMVKS